MNIFYLAHNQRVAAEEHCDSHVIKMILESAQLLSTCHRVVDGEEIQRSIKEKKVWRHPDPWMDATLYKCTHKNHPDSIWLRESEDNYYWLYELMICLNDEFVRRYNKTDPHLTIQKLQKALTKAPEDIDWRYGFSQPPQCMPPQYRVAGDSVQAYRNYYCGEKHFAKWTNTPVPEWYRPLVRLEGASSYVEAVS